MGRKAKSDRQVSGQARPAKGELVDKGESELLTRAKGEFIVDKGKR